MKKLALYFILGIFIILVLTIIRASIFDHVEEEKHIYFEIVFLLLLAVVGEMAVIHLKQPSVMILMLLGVLMSHSFMTMLWEPLAQIFPISKEVPDILRMEDILHVFAQLGAVILLFKVGLHNKIEKIFERENMIVAFLGIVFPFLAGFLYANVTGENFAYSMFLGAALTATSVGVTVAVLKEFGLLEQRFSQIIVGAAIIDDILSLLVLSLVINITSGVDSLLPLAYTIFTAIIFIAGGIIAGRYFIKYIDRNEFTTQIFLLVLSFMLFYSYIAEFIKLSAIVGAFVSGVILNRSKHNKEIEEKTYGLELVFMPIFFISLGVFFDVSALSLFSIPILIISLIAVISKVVPCLIATFVSKLNLREGLIIGIGMIPRGEVALIVASIGLTTKVLTTIQYSVIAAVALVTTIIVPPLLGYAIKKLQ
ncbi:cation:proton antiporter [Candidatus Micrarchaeota archaeon]|nr:cation:proton antiporter [Candidatus Micrarchaeota archaeon]